MKVVINRKEVFTKKDQTILEALQSAGFDIPTLCHHPDLDHKPNCRVCVVEVEGEGFLPSCSTKIEDGMIITTESHEIKKLRKINLEMLFAQHREECGDCVWGFKCNLLKLATKYKVDIQRFKDRKTDYPTYEFGSSLIFDSSKCIDCGNCIEVCSKQGINHLKLEEKDTFHQVTPDDNNPCTYCGQCIMHCPVGAFEGAGEFEDVEKPLKRKDKFVVFQIAPSIRTSIGEEFNMDYGEVVTEQLVSSIKKLGVDKVFDVAVGADFTTKEEAKELLERLEKRENLPMFTSCCPAWVRLIEHYYPEFIPNLTTTRSPHIILGGLIKEYYSSKMDIKNIIVVSVMPCVSKKYEITRKELEVNGIKPVDYVLTTRELAYLFKKNGINLKKATKRKADDIFGQPTGAGVIYGASGGVMESALRTALESEAKIDFKEVRGQQGCKEAEINGIKVAVISGTGTARKMLESLKGNLTKYDYVEVMACPGGCIGGGGQPVPQTKEIIKKRADSLYSIDKTKKIRKAHDNPIVKKIYKTILNKEETIKKLCYTKYDNKSTKSK